MKLAHKRILSGLMIAGDIFMAMVAMMLIFDEDLLIIGLMMLGFLAIDIYLTIDYIRALRHREKVENSLLMDNIRARETKRQANHMSKARPQRPAYRAEEDLSDVLHSPASPEEKAMRH